MSDHVRQTIADLQKAIAEDETKTLEKKRLANQLAAMAGLAPVYGDAELQASSSNSLAVRSDQFYGQPMATAVRQVLEMRKALNQGAATINDVHDAMVSGGFDFNTKNVENAKRMLRISVSKNMIFHRLPNGRYGLREWYPNIKAPKGKNAGADDGEGDDDSEDGGES